MPIEGRIIRILTLQLAESEEENDNIVPQPTERTCVFRSMKRLLVFSKRAETLLKIYI